MTPDSGTHTGVSRKSRARLACAPEKGRKTGECKLITSGQARLLQALSRSEIFNQPLAKHGIAKGIALHAIGI